MGTQVWLAPGTIPFHCLILTVDVPISNSLPVGSTVAFAWITTVPVDKFCLFVVTIAVAFAFVVTLPTVISTLFPVTEIFASATTVTSPVSVLTLDPVGEIFAPAVVETVPVDKSTPLPVTESIFAEAKMDWPPTTLATVKRILWENKGVKS